MRNDLTQKRIDLRMCVRFASLISAISFRSFLMRSDTNFGTDTA